MQRMAIEEVRGVKSDWIGFDKWKFEEVIRKEKGGNWI